MSVFMFNHVSRPIQPRLPRAYLSSGTVLSALHRFCVSGCLSHLQVVCDTLESKNSFEIELGVFGGDLLDFLVEVDQQLVNQVRRE